MFMFSGYVDGSHVNGMTSEQLNSVAGHGRFEIGVTNYQTGIDCIALGNGAHGVNLKDHFIYFRTAGREYAVKNKNTGAMDHNTFRAYGDKLDAEREIGGFEHRNAAVMRNSAVVQYPSGGLAQQGVVQYPSGGPAQQGVDVGSFHPQPPVQQQQVVPQPPSVVPRSSVSIEPQRNRWSPEHVLLCCGCAICALVTFAITALVVCGGFYVLGIYLEKAPPVNPQRADVPVAPPVNQGSPQEWMQTMKTFGEIAYNQGKEAAANDRQPYHNTPSRYAHQQERATPPKFRKIAPPEDNECENGACDVVALYQKPPTNEFKAFVNKEGPMKEDGAKVKEEAKHTVAFKEERNDTWITWKTLVSGFVLMLVGSWMQCSRWAYILNPIGV